NGSQIKLIPWAKIEGTIVSADEAGGEFVLGISAAPLPESDEPQSIRWMFDRTSFSGKNFIVDFVPSTPLHIGRIIQSRQDGPVYIDPQPGQTYEIRFEPDGLTVAGRKLPSLLGKTLPDLKGVSVVFSPDQHKGKMILVCFWDMNQRPSRNCIAQLAGRAEQLRQEGITIVAIQASEVVENVLDKWVRANDIPFPVGTIRSDDEKTRSAWGVRSLPWLILTDKDHVVRAEGFGLSELDEKLAANKEGLRQ
ncbi:MAG: peroxiredoxin family protein, partial [Planctomycetota bacterium]